jgi:hypothetical protein
MIENLKFFIFLWNYSFNYFKIKLNVFLCDFNRMNINFLKTEKILLELEIIFKNKLS